MASQNEYHHPATLLSSQKNTTIRALRTANSNYSEQKQYFHPPQYPEIIRNDSIRVQSQSSHHRVGKPNIEVQNSTMVFIDKIKLHYKGFPVRLEGLALKSLAQFLNVSDAFSLTSLSKHYYNNMVRPNVMDDFWCESSFKKFNSKAGYLCFKNKSLLSIDYSLKDMFYQVERLRHQSLSMQAKMFKYWLYTAFMVLALL